MSLYSKKRKWKIFLAGLACAIVASSLWYSNRLVSKIKKEEKKKVALWSKAVQNRARLVGYTDNLFQDIEQEENQKITFWAKATKRFVESENDIDRSFYSSIITKNTTIPIIHTDKSGNIISWNNLPEVNKTFYSELDSTEVQFLEAELRRMKKHSRPIRIQYFEDKYNLLYYRDSHITQELKRVFDELINTFISETVINSSSVPVLLTDSTQTKVIAFGNLDSADVTGDRQAIQIASMRSENEPLRVELGNGNTNYIFFEDSAILKEMGYYPLAQLFTLGLFLFFAYILFSSFRNEEQNQVWVGMAKETAHQLGTPLSSMLAWIEVLKAKDTDERIVSELSKDVHRLEIITDRFSKIGSMPELSPQDLNAFIEETVGYLRPRLASQVAINLNLSSAKLEAKLSQPLFSWVLENILKNAVDAMDGKGSIFIETGSTPKMVYIDIRDTGKGISSRQTKTVFNPGFTTKTRGWGLGLSLSKRIVENYHSGKIFVKKSELGVGTTFRILLNQ